MSHGNCYLVAADLVGEWLQKHKHYLLDGDPNIMHPKARTELTLRIADALEVMRDRWQVEEEAPPRKRGKAQSDV